jgi:hypothetical protein
MLIETRYIPATNHRASRIKATAPGWNNSSITLTFQECCEREGNISAYGINVHLEAAKELANKLHWNHQDAWFSGGESARGYSFILNTKHTQHFNRN